MSAISSEFQIGELLTRAFDIFKRNLGAFTGAVLVAGLIVLVAVSIGSLLHDVLGSVVGIVLTGPFLLGLYKMCLAGARGQTVSFGTIFEGFDNLVQAMLANLVIWVFTSIGFMCIVIPGVLIYTLFITTFLYMAEGQRDFWPAMESSRRLTQSNFLQWLIVGVIALVLQIAGMALCGIGILVTGPVAALLVTLAYEQQRYGGATTVAPETLP